MLNKNLGLDLKNYPAIPTPKTFQKRPFTEHAALNFSNWWEGGSVLDTETPPPSAQPHKKIPTISDNTGFMLNEGKVWLQHCLYFWHDSMVGELFS